MGIITLTSSQAAARQAAAAERASKSVTELAQDIERERVERSRELIREFTRKDA